MKCLKFVRLRLIIGMFFVFGIFLGGCDATDISGGDEKETIEVDRSEYAEQMKKLGALEERERKRAEEEKKREEREKLVEKHSETPKTEDASAPTKMGEMVQDTTFIKRLIAKALEESKIEAETDDGESRFGGRFSKCMTGLTSSFRCSFEVDDGTVFNFHYYSSDYGPSSLYSADQFEARGGLLQCRIGTEDGLKSIDDWGADGTGDKASAKADDPTTKKTFKSDPNFQVMYGDCLDKAATLLGMKDQS